MMIDMNEVSAASFSLPVLRIRIRAKHRIRIRIKSKAGSESASNQKQDPNPHQRFLPASNYTHAIERYTPSHN
jgi:hypothetical protein